MVDDTERGRLRLRGRLLVAAAVLAFAGTALVLADAGYGRDPHRQFAQRRAYSRVKVDTRAAMLKVMPLALGGGVLLWMGLRTLERASR